MDSNFQIVSIEGNIGSGKSTLLSNLKTYYKNDPSVIFLKEPVDEWEKIKDENGVTMIEKFYADQEKYSFSFQMMAYISRLKVLRDAIQSITDKNKKYIFITERSLYTDKMVFAKMLYDSQKIEHINYQIYLNWFDTFSSDFPVHKIIYVKSDASVCLNRIIKRSRQGEEHIPFEYLDNCNKYHNNMLDKSLEHCVCHNQLVLDGNIDIYENDGQVDEWVQSIHAFIQL